MQIHKCNCEKQSQQLMTLDEAIEHAKEKSGNGKTRKTLCEKQHEQLAAWLIELKDFRMNVPFR